MSQIKGLIAAFSMVSILSACGGNSSGGDSSSTPTGFGNTLETATVTGPLTPVQDAVSTTILEPLASALPAPLSGTVQCADQAVVVDVLDIGNALLNAAMTAGSNPTTSYATALADINTSLEAALSNLALAVNVAAGTNKGSACVAGEFLPTNNLAAALPLINELYLMLESQNSSPNLASIASVVSQLNSILQNGLAQTPDQAATAPVLGGVISLLNDLSSNLTPAANALLTYNAATGNTALETLVSQLLTDALTKVIPLSSIDPTGTAANEVASSVRQIATALGTVTGPLLTAVLSLASGGLASVLAPIEAIL